MRWRKLLSALGIDSAPLLSRLGIRVDVSWPRFHEQTRPWTCALACTRMVLEFEGVDRSEDELLEKYCRMAGSSPIQQQILGGTQLSLNAELATRTLPSRAPSVRWSVSKQSTDMIRHVQELLRDRPVVVGIVPEARGRIGHAVLLLEWHPERIVVHDPLRGAARTWEQLGYDGSFVEAWDRYWSCHWNTEDTTMRAN